MENRNLRVCVTGANGTIGSILAEELAKYFKVTALKGRSDLDLLDSTAVENYFKNRQFDCLVHCAIAGADDTGSSDFNIFRTNWVMYENIKHQGRNFSRLINIGSGCELEYGKLGLESDLFKSYPVQPYGMSKNMIARDVIKHIGWCNLRLYGIISKTRVFERLHQAVDQGDKVFTMFNDKYMDYMRVEDIVKIVRHYVIDTSPAHRDVNMVYEKKFLVSEVLTQYIKDNNLPIELAIENITTSDENSVRHGTLDYIGSGSRLTKMKII